MRRAARWLLGSLRTARFGATTALAQRVPGGEASPGTSVTATHLLMTDVVVTPTTGEPTEICNSTGMG